MSESIHEKVRKRQQQVINMQKIAKGSGLVIRRVAKYFVQNNELIDKWGREVGPYGIALYTALSRYSGNETGGTYVSQKKLAEVTGMTDRYIRTMLAKFEEVKMIAVQRRTGTTSIIVLCV